MAAEDERLQEIRKVFFEYAKGNELPAFGTPYFFAKQFLPNESLFLKMQVIRYLIDSRVMKIVNEKWITTKEIL
jgi:hypothetical protein